MAYSFFQIKVHKFYIVYKFYKSQRIYYNCLKKNTSNWIKCQLFNKKDFKPLKLFKNIDIQLMSMTTNFFFFFSLIR